MNIKQAVSGGKELVDYLRLIDWGRHPAQLLVNVNCAKQFALISLAEEKRPVEGEGDDTELGRLRRHVREAREVHDLRSLQVLEPKLRIMERRHAIEEGQTSI